MNDQLAWRANVSHGQANFDAFADLVGDVFESDATPYWPAVAAFDASGRCVAGVQRAMLDLRIDKAPVRCAALRNIAVAEDRRGRGLMRELFARLLPWVDAHADLGLLYAETADLYARFAFSPLTQHAFEGAAPPPVGPATARRIEGSRYGALVDRLLSARTPLSNRVYMAGDDGLTARALCRDERTLFHDATLDALFLVEDEGDVLVLADVVAATMPTAARILGALSFRPCRLRTLFPPDRLCWAGDPVVEDAGLMVRGLVPDALRQPFILPPTVEF